MEYEIGGCGSEDYWDEQHKKKSSMTVGSAPESLWWMHELAEADVAGKRVMDIGVGNGSRCELLKAAGAEVVGCDIVEAALERLPPGIERVLRGGMRNVPPVDYALSGVCFQHCPDGEIIEIVRDVPLVPGGQLRGQIASWVGEDPDGDKRGVHWWRTPEQYSKLVELGGRKVVSINPLKVFGSIAWHSLICE